MATPKFPGSAGARVTLTGLRKTFPTGKESISAIEQANLTISPGSTVAITGQSGSGKSTMLHLIGAILQPDEGKLQVDDLDLTALSRRELASYRRTIGLVFQHFYLLPALTVLDNVLAPLMPTRTTFNKKKRAFELLDAVGLADRATAVPAQLSGGQQQRVAIARALVAYPRLVLADEPTGSLDSATGAAVMDLLLSLQSECGTTLVFATHEVSLANRCNRMIALRDGRIISDTMKATDEPDCGSMMQKAMQVGQHTG